jgi:hypothetical protein
MDNIFLCPLVIKRCHQEENEKICAKPSVDTLFNIYNTHQLHHSSDVDEEAVYGFSIYFIICTTLRSVTRNKNSILILKNSNNEI